MFQFGPLDQGWWPDGLYTAPTDEALVYDIQKTKYLGFNMIRKHIKVEPARWYTHCDQLGIIVWQDMPSGDRNPEWQNRKYFEGTEKKRSAVSEACYRKEWKEIMDCLYPEGRNLLSAATQKPRFLKYGPVSHSVFSKSEVLFFISILCSYLLTPASLRARF